MIILMFVLDKKKKLLITTLLQAFGYPRDSIISLFYNFDTIQSDMPVNLQSVDEALLGQRIEKDMLSEKYEKSFLVSVSPKDTLGICCHKEGIKNLFIRKKIPLNPVVGKDSINLPETGEILA